jgi:hypothetical protein
MAAVTKLQVFIVGHHLWHGVLQALQTLDEQLPVHWAMLLKAMTLNRPLYFVSSLLQFLVRLVMYYIAAATGVEEADFYSTVSYYLIR